MTALEALQAVQFVTVKKKRFAVIEIEEWEALIEWLTELEDLQVFKDSYDALDQAGGDRQRAGWLRWDHARDQIVYAVDEATSSVDVMAVRQRPPYDYGDLAELIQTVL